MGQSLEGGAGDPHIPQDELDELSKEDKKAESLTVQIPPETEEERHVRENPGCIPQPTPTSDKPPRADAAEERVTAAIMKSELGRILGGKSDEEEVNPTQRGPG